ncbi:MAG: class I SAM-dependent methyltransferase [Butyrivibrio sp.]|nr:class I SAM-dependent methyltransferase [Acetatifactor muris]MCM1559832.1 class I SAM-dependent methyltransferase [Butyrivibrio sp.]
MNRTLSYYDKNAEEFCRATKDADMSFCRDKFLRFLKQKEYKIHILDAGCGSGRDAKAFLDAGYKVTALDASGKICEEAEKLLNQKVLCMRFEEMQFQQEFDGIWACASLLHISYIEMREVLKRFWYALKEDGILYASFKYGKGMRIDKGRLFYDYEEIELKKLMISNGFWVEDIFITRDVRENRESEQWINVLAGKSKTSK